MEATPVPADFGPMPPPPTVNGLKTDSVEQSELKNSIKKKGQNSYYYAHNYGNQNFNDENAKKFYGDGLIYGGEPTLISSNQIQKPEAEEPAKVAKKIQKYSWNDEGEKVKIYIELNQFPGQITKDMVNVSF